MADKQAKNADTGAAVAVDDPAKVRNVVLVGPSGSGKTTLTEALLAASGTVPRAGSVVEGTTVCDHDPAAVRQQRSVGLSVAPVLHQGHKINLIDTPGYADFVGELQAGLRAADAALFVVCAAEGVDAATVAVWEECAAVGMPRAVVVSRLDHHRADAMAEIAACQAAFGAGVLPLYLPAGDGLVGLITQRYFDYSGGHPPRVGEPDPADLERMSEARNELIEGIIAESEDESLMERYLGGEEIAEETLIADLETAVARGTFHPVIPVCATSGIGLAEVLDGIVRAFPSPLEHRPRTSPRRTAGRTPPSPPTPRAPSPRRSSGRPSTPTSAGCRSSGCFPGRCGRSARCTCPGTGSPNAGTRTTTPTSASRTSTPRSARTCGKCPTASRVTSAR